MQLVTIQQTVVSLSSLSLIQRSCLTLEHLPRPSQLQIPWWVSKAAVAKTMDLEVSKLHLIRHRQHHSRRRVCHRAMQLLISKTEILYLVKVQIRAQRSIGALTWTIILKQSS